MRLDHSLHAHTLESARQPSPTLVNPTAHTLAIMRTMVSHAYGYYSPTEMQSGAAGGWDWFGSATGLHLGRWCGLWRGPQDLCPCSTKVDAHNGTASFSNPSTVTACCCAHCMQEESKANPADPSTPFTDNVLEYPPGWSLDQALKFMQTTFPGIHLVLRPWDGQADPPSQDASASAPALAPALVEWAPVGGGAPESGLPHAQDRLRELLAAAPQGILGHSVKGEYVKRFGVTLESDLGPMAAMKVKEVLGPLPDVSMSVVNTQPLYKLIDGATPASLATPVATSAVEGNKMAAAGASGGGDASGGDGVFVSLLGSRDDAAARVTRLLKDLDKGAGVSLNVLCEEYVRAFHRSLTDDMATDPKFHELSIESLLRRIPGVVVADGSHHCIVRILSAAGPARVVCEQELCLLGADCLSLSCKRLHWPTKVCYGFKDTPSHRAGCLYKHPSQRPYELVGSHGQVIGVLLSGFDTVPNNGLCPASCKRAARKGPEGWSLNPDRALSQMATATVWFRERNRGRPQMVPKVRAGVTVRLRTVGSVRSHFILRWLFRRVYCATGEVVFYLLILLLVLHG